MQLTGNTVLVTGGGSGIGLALAKEFLAVGNRVIVAGRDEKKLSNAAASSPGLAWATMDITDPANIKEFAARLSGQYPQLNTIIHSAGIMVPENLLAEETDSSAENTIATNLLGTIRLTRALLPTLQEQPAATILTVSSGLAFVPMALTPTYSATKAAIHSYSQSLRYQLRNTAIQVIELVPPYVATSLMGERQASDPNAMPLDEFIAETMELLKSQQNAEEILVQRVHRLRFAERNGDEQYRQFFRQFNSGVMAGHH